MEVGRPLMSPKNCNKPKPVTNTSSGNGSSQPIGNVVFDISLKDNTTNAKITNFATNNLALTINIPTISANEDPNTLGLYYLNEITNQWVRVEGATFNLSTKQVTANLNHLTKFAVFKSTAQVLNTDETKKEDLNIVPPAPVTPPSDLVETPSDKVADRPTLTIKQLTTYKGKFITDKLNNIFYIDSKSKKLEQVTTDKAIKYLAKIALGINNANLNKINNTSDKKVTLFSKKQAGKVLLQVENKGQLWYVNKQGKKEKVYDAFGLIKVIAGKI